MLAQQQQQLPYFAHEQISLDADVMDSYGFHPQSLYDPALWMEQPSDMQKHMLFPPNSPPSMAASHYSAASGASIASASSSAMGSPYSGAAHTFQESWVDTANGLMGLPGAMMPELDFNPMANVDADSTYATAKFPTVDPTAIHHAMSYTEDLAHPPPHSHSSGFVSPAPIGSPLPSQHQNLSFSQMPQPHITSSPYLGAGLHYRDHYRDHHQQLRSTSVHERPASIISALSPRSHPSPAASSSSGSSNTDVDVEDTTEAREKRRCPWPDCGRSFKDLKAHMLTHQSERPEKCPIVNCEYHLKGFARKYDKNRHTLTHYKGTMVCGFCPGSGSAAEKSFNRADVFKRHLMSVHGVEQTAPNCRRRSPTSGSSSDQYSSNSNSSINSSSSSSNSANGNRQKSLAGYSEDATGKCSTCSGTFSNAQDFYEHLDDCVLRVVQQEEPSEAINQKRLAEVAGDEDVKLTMEKHKLLDTATSPEQYDEYNDDEKEDDDDESNNNNNNNHNKATSKSSKSNNHNNGKSRPVLGPNSSSAVTKNNNSNKPRPITRRRGNRNSYPQSWGTPVAKMKTKKRVICAYDGPRRLLKDEMMLDNEFEVRIRLPSGAGDGTNRAAYVTDLDMMSLKRVDGIFSATEEERGPWVGNHDDNGRLMGQPAVLLPEVTQVVDDLGIDIDIDELMAYKDSQSQSQSHQLSTEGLCA